MVHKCFDLEYPNSLVTQSRSCSKETVEVPFFSPDSSTKTLLQSPESCFPPTTAKWSVKKYFSSLLSLSFFICLPCFVLSYLFIPAYIWHGCRSLFLSDFCSSNICFLCVARGEQNFLFIVWQKHLTLLFFETIRIEKMSPSISLLCVIKTSNCSSFSFRSARAHW